MKQGLYWRIDKLSALQWSGMMRFGAFLATSMLLPWLGLSGNDLAIVESWLFVQYMLSFFWINAINTAIFRIPETDSLRNDSISGLSNLACRLSVLLSIPACFLLYTLLPGTENYTSVLALFALSFSFQAGSAMLDSIWFQKSAHLKLFLFSTLINSVFILGSAGIAFLGMNLIYLLIFWTLISAIRFVLFCVEKPRIAFSKPRKTYLDMFIQLQPLLILSALGGASEYVCGLAVRFGLGADDFVLFRYGSREFPLIMIMAGALSNAMSGKIAANQTAAMTELRNRSTALIAITFFFSVALMILSPFLFKTFLPPRLATAWPVFCTILLLGIPRTLFPQTVLLGLRRDRVILQSLVMELMVVVCMLMILLPVCGILAAPLALVLGYLSDKFYLIWHLNKNGIKFNKYSPVYMWLLSALLLFLTWTLVLYFG